LEQIVEDKGKPVLQPYLTWFGLAVCVPLCIGVLSAIPTIVVFLWTASPTNLVRVLDLVVGTQVWERDFGLPACPAEFADRF
jgi:hypothetical protein